MRQVLLSQAHGFALFKDCCDITGATGPRKAPPSCEQVWVDFPCVAGAAAPTTCCTPTVQCQPLFAFFSALCRCPSYRQYLLRHCKREVAAAFCCPVRDEMSDLRALLRDRRAAALRQALRKSKRRGR